MTVDSWLLRTVRFVARLYAWFVAAAAVIFLLATVRNLGWFNDPPDSFSGDVGFDHPALAAGVHMIPGSPLATSHDSPVLGTLMGSVQQFLAAGYSVLVVVLVLRLLDLARRAGPFAELMPRRLRALAWTLILGQPLFAFAHGLCTAYLRSRLLADTTFTSALWTAVGQMLSWPAIASGLGILVFRSVIVEGVGMRRDLEGTV